MIARTPIPDWHAIADSLPTRSARQCRERWRSYLLPAINPEPWTLEEDAILDREFDNLGPKWSAIALFLPGRTEVHVKNRWSKLCRDRSKSAAKRKNQRNPHKERRPIVKLPSISELCAESSIPPWGLAPIPGQTRCDGFEENQTVKTK
jgi:hypothetical protein